MRSRSRSTVHRMYGVVTCVEATLSVRDEGWGGGGVGVGGRKAVYMNPVLFALMGISLVSCPWVSKNYSHV